MWSRSHERQVRGMTVVISLTKLISQKFYRNRRSVSKTQSFPNKAPLHQRILLGFVLLIV